MLFQEPGQPFDECRPLCRIPSAVVPHVENDLPDGVALQYAERLLAELRERRQRRGFLAALELRLAFTPPAGVVEDIVYFFLGEIAIREKHVPFRDRKGQGIGLEGGPIGPLRIGRFERIGLVPVQREFRLPVVCEPEIFQELQRREQLGDHGFHHSLVVDREKGAQAVDYGFDRCLADRCEPVPQQLFVFVGRLYDVQPVGDPKQSDRQYLLPVYQLLEIQHGMRIAQFGDQLLGFERRSKISGLPGRSLDRADCGLEPRFVVFRKEVAMFRGQFAGQVIQVGGPVDAAPALGEGGRDRSDPQQQQE